MHNYFRVRLWVATGLGLFIAVGIGSIEMRRWRQFEPVQATVESAAVECWGGGRSDHYVACAEAKPMASRRTTLSLAYVSPADESVQQAAVRCDTAFDKTPTYVPGQQVEILAHRKDPASIDMRRCTPVSDPS